MSLLQSALEVVQADFESLQLEVQSRKANALELAKERDALKAEVERLKMVVAIWSATFQKYESFKANILARVSTSAVISDYRKCEALSQNKPPDHQRAIAAMAKEKV